MNATCKSDYPVVDGIPVIIDEGKSIFSHSDFLSKSDTFFPASSPLKQRLRRFVPSLGMNHKARENYGEFKALLPTSGTPRVLILGGSIMGEGMEDLLATHEIDFVETDVAFGPRTALILDGHDIPFKDETFDGVIAQAVLEHVLDPLRVVDEIHRVLKTGGVVYAEVPFMQQVHGGRYDFTRFTHSGLRRLFRRFEEDSSGAVAGTGTALAWSYRYFLMNFGRTRTSRRVLSLIAVFTSFWLKYIDILTINTPGGLDGASCIYFLGRKSVSTVPDRVLVAAYRGAM